MLGIVNSINYRQFKQNIKYKILNSETQNFYMKNPHAICGDKKPRGLRAININILYEIKLHKFT